MARRVAQPKVEVMLCQWGRWALRCESGALGFAKSSVLACSGEHDNVDGIPHVDLPRDLIDHDMEQLDSAVRKLRMVLRICVIQVYIRGARRSDRHNAEQLGISRQALRGYLWQAHRKIELDISVMACQNTSQSAIGGIAHSKIIQPVSD